MSSVALLEAMRRILRFAIAWGDLDKRPSVVRDFTSAMLNGKPVSISVNATIPR
jgi:hypothetical protein